MKDTARNIAETGEFVVNLVPFSMVDSMNATSFRYPVGDSEIEHCNITTIASKYIKAPRVAGVAVSFECRLATMTAYPTQQPSCHMILGEVLAAHVDESILDPTGQIDPFKLDLVSRMGADWYGRTSGDKNFTLARPEGWNRGPAT